MSALPKVDLPTLDELVAHYGIDEDYQGEFHDRSVDWHNHNKPRAITSLMKHRHSRLYSQLKLWAYTMGARNCWGVRWDQPVGTPEMFEAALKGPVTIWRGGGGTFDPDQPKDRSWVSYTASRERVESFSKFNNTYARRSHAPSRPRFGPWWEVELTLPLDRVQLFLTCGMDFEVIVSKKDACGSVVVRTHEEK